MIPSKPLLALCALTLTSASCPSKDCKAFPGSPDWPSDSEWTRLNNDIDGQLLNPELPGGVCHEGQPNYDGDQCSVIAEAWTTFEFHVADPFSLMMNQFSNFTCLPDPQFHCSGQGYPSYVANVTTAKHVKAAVDFGKHTSPKDTGQHSANRRPHYSAEVERSPRRKKYRSRLSRALDRARLPLHLDAPHQRDLIPRRPLQARRIWQGYRRRRHHRRSRVANVRRLQSC